MRDSLSPLCRTYYHLKNVGMPSMNVNLYVNNQSHASIFLLQLPCTLSTVCLWLCFSALTHHYFSWSLGEILFIELKRSISHIPLEHGTSSLSNLPKKKPRGNHFTKHLGAFFYVQTENTLQSATWRNLRLRPIAVVATSEVPPTCVRLELVHSLNPSLVDKPWIKDRFVIFLRRRHFFKLATAVFVTIFSAVPFDQIE